MTCSGGALGAWLLAALAVATLELAITTLLLALSKSEPAQAGKLWNNGGLLAVS